MPYVTISVTKNHQLSFDDILFGISQNDFDSKTANTHDTRTVFRKNISENLLSRIGIGEMITSLQAYVTRYQALITTEDKTSLYRSFKIPKRSGGLRQINAPQGELMNALRELKYLFEKHLYASYHTSAFAYIQGRSTVDALKRHQANNSRWFLKLDFHDFFGSTTPEFVMEMLSQIFPFSEIISDDEGKEALEKALSLCFLNGGLPQGTPMSPMLTNLVMIPVDHRIAKYCREHTPHLVYTRYADDIFLSSDLKFEYRSVQNDLVDLLDKFHAPFQLNTQKTRFGSRNGRNWNLGLMLNKDNQITVGHQKKRTLKTMIFQFCQDCKHGNPWSIEDTQYLQGVISYCKAVEGDVISNIINDYSTKTGVDVEKTIKEIIHG